MKNIIITTLLFIPFLCFAGVEEANEYSHNMSTFINSKQYEEAALYSSKYFSKDISEGYRAVAFFISKASQGSNNSKLVEQYLIKGCELGDFHSCRERADLLIKQEKHHEAEEIYINIADKYQDPASAGALISLYHNRSWSGFNIEKAKYWQTELSKLTKRKSNN